MYHRCRLVHADLSEYNMLYHKGRVYFIDVSQSVEHDHPNALQFLRMDCTNVTNYFRRAGVMPMRIKELFDFITDPSISDENVDTYLETTQEEIAKRPQEPSDTDMIDEEVFKNSFIPRTLDGVLDAERDIARARNKDEEMIYSKVTGLTEALNVRTVPDLLTATQSNTLSEDKMSNESKHEGDTTSSSESGTEENDSELGESKSKYKSDITVSGIKNLSKEERKKFKKEFKEAKRELRKAKRPKQVKKRKKNLAKRFNRQSIKKR